MNPWMTAQGGGGNGDSGSFWSDTPFPKEGSTYQGILDELVEQLYEDLYKIIQTDDLPPEIDETSDAKPEGSMEENTTPTSSGRTKVTGVYEAPVPSSGDRAGAAFPSDSCLRVCGKLALLYPLKHENVNSAINRKLEDSNWVSTKTCNLLSNWLKEMYSDEISEDAIESAKGCFCNPCGRSFKAYNFRIRCAECSDYDLCEKCFAEGKETESHRKTHRYIPIGPQNKPLFKDQWSASEELVLLEAVGKYGFGNWNEVSEWVAIVSPANTVVKDKDVCRKHYFDFHLMNRKTSRIWPIQNLKSKLLYDGSLGFTQAMTQHCGWPDTGHQDNIKQVDHIDYSPIYDSKGMDMMITGKKPRSMDAEKQWPPEYATDEYEQPSTDCFIYHQSCKPAGALPPRVSIVGYLPNRGEFDNEWENNYELSLCDLEIKDYETPMEKELKLKAIEAYNTILDQRAIRKRLYLDKYILNTPNSNPGGSSGGTATNWNSTSASGGSAAGLDFKTRWLNKNTTSDVKEIFEGFRQLWQYVYTNRCEYPAALFTKNQKHHECIPDVLPADLDEIPDLISDDAQLVDRLDLLTEWKKCGLRTLAEVVEKGSDAALAIDRRESVQWAFKSAIHTVAKTAGEPAELKSEGSSSRIRTPQYTESDAMTQQVRSEEEKVQVKDQDPQVKNESTPEEGSKPNSASSESQQHQQISSNPVLSFMQRQVVSQDTATPPARTIPKKRRMLNVEEEGEIPGA